MEMMGSFYKVFFLINFFHTCHWAKMIPSLCICIIICDIDKNF